MDSGLVVSPVRPIKRVLEQKNNLLPVLRGRFSNLEQTQQVVSVGLFVKPKVNVASVQSISSPESNEKSMKDGISGRLTISVEQTIETTDSATDETKMKLCSSPVRKQSRPAPKSSSMSKSLFSLNLKAGESKDEGKLQTTANRLSASTGTNPWAEASALRPWRQKGMDTRRGFEREAVRRGSTPTASTVSFSRSMGTFGMPASDVKTRAKSSHLAKRIGSGLDSTTPRASSTQSDIERYRAAANARISKALEKQKQAKQLQVELTAMKRQRGDNADEKASQRRRYRAEVYAVNAALCKREKQSFSVFKAEHKGLSMSGLSFDSDDESIDSDDSGSIGERHSNPDTPSRERSSASQSPQRSPASRTAMEPPDTPGASVPHSPSRFGGV